MTGRNEYTVCPACETKNSTDEEYCLKYGQELTESSHNEIKSDEKIKISKDRIILLDLNYTLISNSETSDLTNCLENLQQEII